MFCEGNLCVRRREWALLQKQADAFVLKSKKYSDIRLTLYKTICTLQVFNSSNPKNVFHVHDTIQYRYSCCKARHDANVHDDVLLYAMA
jgi:hypothetical protein